jgi:DNA-directed RNA polymerase alpha subunit
MSERHWLHPTPELPDDTPLESIRFPTRIYNVIVSTGFKTVGQIRETSDVELLTLQNCGMSTVAYLRETLGFPSTEGVRPRSK